MKYLSIKTCFLNGGLQSLFSDGSGLKNSSGWSALVIRDSTS